MENEAIVMRFSLFVLAFVAAAIGFAGLAFASGSLPVPTGNCVDGTPYGACSSATPGQYCTGTQGNLVLGPNIKTCPCEKYFGWKQQGTGDDATCVQTKCTDGTESGACSSTKPQQCVAGALIDNATKCGCLDPTKQQISANGQTCEYKPCSDGTKDGICSSKAEGKKCVQGSLVDKASDCPCTGGYTKQGETCVMLCEDGTKAGECTKTKPKECVLSGTGVGLALDNAGKCGCPEGQTASGTRCIPSVLGGLSGSDILGGSSGSSGQNASGTASGTGTSGLSCCCLPTALIGLASGFVFFRKKEE